MLDIKEIVNKKYNENYEYNDLLVLSLYALIKKFPSNKDIIIDTFNKTNIFIENNKVTSILKNHNIEKDYFYNNDLENESFFINAISSTGEYIILEDNEFKLLETTPFIIVNSNTNKTILLNSFIHELLHLIKAYNNSYFIDNDEIEEAHYLRSGLHLYKYSYNKNNNTYEEGDYFSTIDEVINVIETTEVLEIIKDLEGIIPDKLLNDYISSLDKSLLTTYYGYEESVSLFKPLWDIKEFKDLIENNIINGNTNEIIEGFEQLETNHSFYELSNSLEEIDYYSEGSNKKEYFKSKRILQEIINSLKEKHITYSK